jgi:hypothetical protein
MNKATIGASEAARVMPVTRAEPAEVERLHAFLETRFRELRDGTGEIEHSACSRNASDIILSAFAMARGVATELRGLRQ